MAIKKRLIDVDVFLVKFYKQVERYGDPVKVVSNVPFLIESCPTVDAVEVEDKELLKAIKILVEQYGHSKRSDYVHSPVAHALHHTWKKVDEAGRRKERQ